MQLIRAAIEGSKAAERALFARLQPFVRAWVFGRLRRGKSLPIPAEDFINQTWVRLLDGRLEVFDPDKQSLEGWAAMCLQQELIRQFRARSVRPELSELEFEPESKFEPGPEALVLAKERAERLRAHLEQELRPRGLLVLRLIYDDGLSAEEAAGAMGVNKQVIFNWTHRIRKLAREFLEGESAE